MHKKDRKSEKLLGVMISVFKRHPAGIQDDQICKWASAKKFWVPEGHRKFWILALKHPNLGHLRLFEDKTALRNNASVPEGHLTKITFENTGAEATEAFTHCPALSR